MFEVLRVKNLTTVDDYKNRPIAYFPHNDNGPSYIVLKTGNLHKAISDDESIIYIDDAWEEFIIDGFAYIVNDLSKVNDEYCYRGLRFIQIDDSRGEDSVGWAKSNGRFWFIQIMSDIDTLSSSKYITHKHIQNDIDKKYREHFTGDYYTGDVFIVNEYAERVIIGTVFTKEDESCIIWKK